MKKTIGTTLTHELRTSKILTKDKRKIKSRRHAHSHKQVYRTGNP